MCATYVSHLAPVRATHGTGHSHRSRARTRRASGTLHCGTMPLTAALSLALGNFFTLSALALEPDRAESGK